MIVDAVAGSARHVADDRAKSGVVDLVRPPAPGTDHVVVVGGLAADVGVLARREVQALHGSQLLENLEAIRFIDPAPIYALRSAFKELGYESWSEDNQRSEKNSPYVYQGIMDVLRRHKHKVGKFSAK